MVSGVQIQVLGQDPINAQARIYAEYRFFAALTQSAVAADVRLATVQLRPLTHRRHGAHVSCVVNVGFVRGAPVRIRTTGPHAYAAINRAVERLRSAVRPAPAGAPCY